MFDYLIKNGQLIDGTGSPARRADVGITDGKIAAIGDLSAAQAGTVIDAAGKTVTPGFIDIHTHGAVGADFCDADLPGLKRMAAYLKSCGITTFCPTSMTV